VPTAGDIVDVLRLGSHILVLGASTSIEPAFVRLIETCILVSTADATFAVVLERDGDLTDAIEAFVQTVGGTAQAGVEYIDSAQTATWAAGVGGQFTLTFALVAPVAGHTQILRVTSGDGVCIPMQAVEVVYFYQPPVNWNDVDNWLTWDALEATATWDTLETTDTTGN